MRKVALGLVLGVGGATLYVDELVGSVIEKRGSAAEGMGEAAAGSAKKALDNLFGPKDDP